MSIELSRLLECALFEEEVENASVSIERMLETFEHRTHAGARLFEVVAPSELDLDWVRERLAHPLIYFCESEGTPVPECGAVVVALFVGRKLYGIPAADAIRWAAEVLAEPVEQLREEYGTHEIETALR